MMVSGRALFWFFSDNSLIGLASACRILTREV